MIIARKLRVVPCRITAQWKPLRARWLRLRRCHNRPPTASSRSHCAKPSRQTPAARFVERRSASFVFPAATQTVRLHRQEVPLAVVPTSRLTRHRIEFDAGEQAHYCKYGFVARSVPIVVNEPCPGTTGVASG